MFPNSQRVNRGNHKTEEVRVVWSRVGSKRRSPSLSHCRDDVAHRAPVVVADHHGVQEQRLH